MQLDGYSFEHDECFSYAKLAPEHEAPMCVLSGPGWYTVADAKADAVLRYDQLVAESRPFRLVEQNASGVKRDCSAQSLPMRSSDTGDGAAATSATTVTATRWPSGLCRCHHATSARSAVVRMKSNSASVCGLVVVVSPISTKGVVAKIGPGVCGSASALIVVRPLTPECIFAGPKQ